MILQLDGLQDKKSSIESYYKNYDDMFKMQKSVESRFRHVIDSINEACHGKLFKTEFRRPPLFYSLYGAVYHRLYALPKVKLASPKRKRLSKIETEGLSDAVMELSEQVRNARNDEPVFPKYSKFVTACLSQTDNIRPRRVRMETIYRAAF